MSEMKHTPGPWFVVDRPGGEIGIYATLPDGKSDFAEFKYRTDVPVMLFHDIWVQFPPKGWDEMQRANARLMAAAPNLLKALKKCAAVCSGDAMSKKGLIEALEAARSAITEAEGLKP